MSKNIVSAQQHITQYTQVIGQLKQEIASLRRQIVVVQSAGIKQGNGPRKLEDDLERLLLAINEHFSDESNVRKSLYKIRQKIETLTLAISIKKNQYESLSSSEAAEKLMKEIGSNEIQLKQLVINEEVLIRRMHELARMREVIGRNVLQKQLLAEKWVTLLSRQLSCDKNVIFAIPQEGDVIRSEAEEMIKVQTSVVEHLMEQIQVKGLLKGKRRFLAIEFKSRSEIDCLTERLQFFQIRAELLRKVRKLFQEAFQSIQQKKRKSREQVQQNYLLSYSQAPNNLRMKIVNYFQKSHASNFHEIQRLIAQYLLDSIRKIIERIKGALVSYLKISHCLLGLHRAQACQIFQVIQSYGTPFLNEAPSEEDEIIPNY